MAGTTTRLDFGRNERGDLEVLKFFKEKGFPMDEDLMAV